MRTDVEGWIRVPGLYREHKIGFVIVSHASNDWRVVNGHPVGGVMVYELLCRPSQTDAPALDAAKNGHQAESSRCTACQGSGVVRVDPSKVDCAPLDVECVPCPASRGRSR